MLLVKIRSFEEQHKLMLSTLDREYADSRERALTEKNTLKKENEDILRQLGISQLKFKKGLEEAQKAVDEEKERTEQATLAQKKAEEQRNALVKQLAKLR